MSEAVGYLTAEDIKRAMDSLWNGTRAEPQYRNLWDDPLLPGEMPGADELAERASDEVEAWAAAHPRRCGAVLFPLEPSRDIVTLVVREAWANGVPVHPVMVPYGDPLQGPTPALCARWAHLDSPWHWDGKGTWWQ